MNLNQISLPATDLGASIVFFKALGLRLIVETPVYARFESPQGEATMSLHKTDDALQGDGIYVYFECDDVDARVAALISAGVVFDSGPQTMRWLWREAWLSDPAGNRICLFNAGVNRKYPPWRID